jgi:diguanylate cyclase (GGDEF)-like protein
VNLREPQNDRLTGLPNRQTLTAALIDLLRAPAPNGEIGALLLFDIDRFHRVNDAGRHQAGDELLRRVASGLRTWSDGRCTLARTGGNEFAVVLTAGAEEDVRAAQPNPAPKSSSASGQPSSASARSAPNPIRWSAIAAVSVISNVHP